MELVNVKIYQIEETLDNYHVKFKDSDFMKKCYYDKPSLLEIYEKVYDGTMELDGDNFGLLIENIMDLLERNALPNFIGTRELQVSDIILVDGIHYFYIDSDGAVRI